ncbi:MAG: DegT/DnrJ/EryC1/StrS family aminotransferase [Saprospiraceae bacterium]|uniref:DegT/DnrJ/EryC1/StrS family aminotransferase n=1 Tax=Candidatus Opimibacter skivensis TaxID=2982028 RepID=A0A9D7SY63_9BACT|nr:DegT/DnrJ/EryC1/StrS family aminotransferase [Candidatus Opimibacter skivensis]
MSSLSKHIPLVDLVAQYYSIQSEMDDAISGVIHSGRFIGGEEVKKFAIKFAGFSNVPYCVPCANGTDSLEIALAALGIGKGDEVIIPAFSFVATLEAVCNIGATPVLCDIDPIRYTMDARNVEAVMTEKTKAIIPVHLYGQMADMHPLMLLAGVNNFYVIEDAAQAHGAEYNGQIAGSIGHMGSFSFYPGKNLGAYGDAGAITTNDEQLYNLAFKIANHGRTSKYDHEIVGRNSRMDSLQAAVLSVKLAHLREWNKRRFEIANRYIQLLEDIEQITVPVINDQSKSVYHLFVIRVPKSKRDDLMKYLAKHSIETGIHYPISLSKLKVTTEQLKIVTNCPQSEKASEEVVSLPMYPELTEAQQEYICNHIQDFFST